MSDTPLTDDAVSEMKQWKLPFLEANTEGCSWQSPIVALCRKLERERREARTLESAIDVIMAAPLPDILRLFRERGILATMTTTAKEGAK